MAPRFQHESEDITDIVTDNARDIAELRRGGGWTEVTADELEAKTVPELKEAAKAAGVDATGTKSELVEALTVAEPAVAAPAPKGKTASK